MFIPLTSAMTKQKSHVRADDIVMVEPWHPALSGDSVIDPMNGIPTDTQSNVRLSCGLIIPVMETNEQVLEMIGEKVPS